jgi:hypothetical protein
MVIGSSRILAATDDLASTYAYIGVVGVVWAVLGMYFKRRIDRRLRSEDQELSDGQS